MRHVNFFYMNPKHQELLQQKLTDLPFSQELKSILDKQGFDTLEDLLKLKVHEWHKELSGFNYHHQHEIVDYLMKNNLERYLREE